MAEGGAPPPAAMKRGMSSGMSVVIVIVVAILAFLAGGYLLGPIVAAPPQLETIVIGTNTPFPPFEDRDPDTKAVFGFDVDLMNEVGKRNGWNVVWRNFQDWDALLAAIQFEGVDVGASAITSNLGGQAGEDREAAFDFSTSYYEADQGVLVLKSNPGVTCAAAECTPDELANHTVAVQTLTTSYWWVLGNLVDTAKTPESLVSDFGDLTQVIQELLNGNVDWVLVDKPIAENLAAANANLQFEGTIETNELYAFAVANTDPKGLLPDINSALADMQADGTFTRILNKWFS